MFLPSHRGGRDPSNIERTVWVPICVAENYDVTAMLASRPLGGLYGQSFDHIVCKCAVLGTPEVIAKEVVSLVRKEG